ncbi:MAG: hypothetical protein M3R52_01535, partial [Acidobacteriota bacterium]|nr:hypothetical protein [Acidobacteriota bacterium]
PPANLKQRFDQMNVRVYGDVSSVKGIVITSEENGKVLDRTIFTDVFAHRDGGLQPINAQENKIQKLERKLITVTLLALPLLKRIPRDLIRKATLTQETRTASLAEARTVFGLE